jgi:protoheme IX farnesyltransferase
MKARAETTTDLSLPRESPESPPAALAGALAARLADYAAMTKPRAMVMVCVTAAVGFAVARPQDLATAADVAAAPAGWWTLAALMIGTYLSGGGSIALNQCWEFRLDRRMDRTRDRPLPSGRISVAEGVAFASAISVVGVALLWWAVNPLTAVLAAITHLTYVFIYTPMKRVNSLCTPVGAITGAIPPMMGWTAVTGTLDRPGDLGAWVLFAILFLWQMPHALAIAWIYKTDYSRAGFRVLSVDDADGRHTRFKTALHTAALLPVSLLPTLIGLTGPVYFFGALALGLGLLVAGIPVGRTPSPTPARRLLIATSVYLVALLTLMVADRT